MIGVAHHPNLYTTSVLRATLCHTGRNTAQISEARLGPQGRLVIPASLRRTLGLQPGDVVVLRVDGDRLVLERREAILARLRGHFAAVVPPGVSLADELIAERREEARRENAE